MRIIIIIIDFGVGGRYALLSNICKNFITADVQ